MQLEASTRAIEVPLDADEIEVRIGTVLDDKTDRIGLGRHRRIFQAQEAKIVVGISFAYVLRLSFIRSAQQKVAILKQNGLASGRVLTTTADPA